MKQLPEGMQKNAKTTTNGGTQFKDPSNPKGNNVRVEPGNPKSSKPGQQSPYVKETRNGQSVDKNGNPASPKSEEAHIPKDEYKYNRNN